MFRLCAMFGLTIVPALGARAKTRAELIAELFELCRSTDDVQMDGRRGNVVVLPIPGVCTELRNGYWNAEEGRHDPEWASKVAETLLTDEDYKEDMLSYKAIWWKWANMKMNGNTVARTFLDELYNLARIKKAGSRPAGAPQMQLNLPPKPTKFTNYFGERVGGNAPKDPNFNGWAPNPKIPLPLPPQGKKALPVESKVNQPSNLPKEKPKKTSAANAKLLRVNKDDDKSRQNMLAACAVVARKKLRKTKFSNPEPAKPAKPANVSGLKRLRKTRKTPSKSSKDEVVLKVGDSVKVTKRGTYFGREGKITDVNAVFASVELAGSKKPRSFGLMDVELVKQQQRRRLGNRPIHRLHELIQSLQ